MLKIIYFSSVSQTAVEFTILLAYDIILYKEELQWTYMKLHLVQLEELKKL